MLENTASSNMCRANYRQCNTKSSSAHIPIYNDASPAHSAYFAILRDKRIFFMLSSGRRCKKKRKGVSSQCDSHAKIPETFRGVSCNFVVKMIFFLFKLA